MCVWALLVRPYNDSPTSYALVYVLGHFLWGLARSVLDLVYVLEHFLWDFSRSVVPPTSQYTYLGTLCEVLPEASYFLLFVLGHFLWGLVRTFLLVHSIIPSWALPKLNIFIAQSVLLTRILIRKEKALRNHTQSMPLQTVCQFSPLNHIPNVLALLLKIPLSLRRRKENSCITEFNRKKFWIKAILPAFKQRWRQMKQKSK